MNIHTFSFNAFQVNTYLIWDETLECIIIDAACYQEFERDELLGFIKEKGLKPVKLLNTHCHVDHLLGNSFIFETFQLRPIIHRAGQVFLVNAIEHAWSFGFEMDTVIEPAEYVEEGDEIVFGKSRLKVLYTPGHADGSICLLSVEGEFVISGDVLFKGSIGRTDLPTGNFDILLGNITNKLLSLPSHYAVYPGHRQATSIEAEMLYNPYLEGSDL